MKIMLGKLPVFLKRNFLELKEEKNLLVLIETFKYMVSDTIILW